MNPENYKELDQHGQTIIDIDPSDYVRQANRIRTQAYLHSKSCGYKLSATLVAYNPADYDVLGMGSKAISWAAAGCQLGIMVYRR